MEVGRRLAVGVPRGEQEVLARHLGVRRRTLRAWRKLAETHDESYRGPGRPAHSEEAHRAARVLVEAVLEELGPTIGERTVDRVLARRVPLRLIRSALRELKAEHRARKRRAQEEQRKHVRVLARDAIWSLDGTHLGRDLSANPVVGELVRDVASTLTHGASIGSPPSSFDVVVLLQRIVDETGVVPLVLAHDNGPENAGLLNAWCRHHGVIQLRNLPYTPQHNPWVERGNRELKAHTGLGKGALIPGIEEAAIDVRRAFDRIDGRIPRATRAWMTAREAYAALPGAQALVDRDALVQATDCAIREAVQDCCSARERRLAEREAILKTLEHFELIERTRGRAKNPTAKAEGIS